jgi:hypothetical protein
MGADLDTWAEAYVAMDRLSELAPWQWMADRDVFAVRDKATDEVGYVSVLGAGGESFGVLLFLGSYGFWTLQRQIELGDRLGAGDAEPSELLEYMPFAVSATFEDREDVSAVQRRYIRELGLSYRGRQAWPSVRFHEPGYAPGEPSDDHVSFLCLALYATMYVAERTREKPDSLPGGADGMLTLSRGANGRWAQSVHHPRGVSRPVPAPFDYGDLARMAGIEAGEATGVWEVDFFHIPGFVNGGRGERAYTPRVAVVVDATSKRTLKTLVEPPDLFLRQAQAELVNLLAHARPAAIRVRHADAIALLRPMSRAFGCRLVKTDSLPGADSVRHGLIQQMEAMAERADGPP